MALKHFISENLWIVSEQFHFDHCKGAVRRYPDKGACALKWGAPLCWVIGYDISDINIRDHVMRGLKNSYGYKRNKNTKVNSHSNDPRKC